VADLVVGGLPRDRGYIDAVTWAGMSAEEQRAAKDSRRGGGPGRGQGPRRGGCNYCRLVRGVAVSEHDERTCPFMAAERSKAPPPGAVPSTSTTALGTLVSM